MRIALTYTGHEVKHNNYVQWLKRAGDIDVVTLSPTLNNLEELKTCNGLVLSGGVDVYPKVYGNTRLEYPNKPTEFNEDRDQFEITAYRIAEEAGMPILGVCRGLQLINCIHGGTLQQDLGVNLNEVHRAVPDDKAHGIHITAGSMLYDIAKKERAVVNSAHHQAVMELGKGLRVTARADDETVEAIERDSIDNNSFLLCIQWHPERMFKFDLDDSSLARGVRDRFLAAANNFVAVD
jgi:putative glutamine amidotransferase